MSKLAETSRFIDIKKSYNLSQKAIALSRKKGTEKDRAYSYIYSIKVFKKADSIKQMLTSADKAVFFAEKLNDKTLTGIAYHYKGFVELNLNESQKSMLYFFRALENLEGTKEYKTLSKTYYNIYGSYAEKGDLDNEGKYAKLCLETALKSNDVNEICNANQAMGTYFTDRFSKNKEQNDFDESIDYFKKALDVFQKNSGKIVAQNQYGVVALNIASLYLMSKDPQAKNMALKYTNLALTNAEKNNDLLIASNCYGIQSELAKKDRDFVNAEKFLLKAKTLVENGVFRDEYVSSNIYESLANFYTERKNKDLALIYFQKYLESYKKLNDARKKSDIRLLEAKFQTQKKDEQLQLLTQKNKLQNLLNYLYLTLVVFVVFGLLFFYRASKFKLQFEKQKSIVLEAQKEEAELLAKLKEEETARLSAESRLAISQKEYLQKKLLAGTLHVEHKNELLQKVKDKFVKEKLGEKIQQKLNRIIKEESMIDNDFEKVQAEVDSLIQVHPDFFEKIQYQSTQKLTMLDLKYCVAIYSGASTKQMALLFSVEPESIRMSKYRIKQKLNLPREKSLEDFLSEL